MNQTLGILGVGHLARALVDGLMSGPFAEHARAGGLLLSPRGEQASRDLASRHGIARATDNASLVRHSEVILLATRPAQVAQAVAGLPFRPEQARALVTGTLHAAGSMLTGHAETSPQRFLEILATPGGVTELGLTVLNAGDGLVAWRAACDAVLARVRKA